MSQVKYPRLERDLAVFAASALGAAMCVGALLGVAAVKVVSLCRRQ